MFEKYAQTERVDLSIDRNPSLNTNLKREKETILENQGYKDKKRHEIQLELNSLGASDLVIDLFTSSDISDCLFKENAFLAIALLEGGNSQVQKTIYDRLINDKDSERFFKNFHYRIELAQKEIKNTTNNFSATDLNDGKTYIYQNCIK